jgi:hypothetical protein
MSGMGEKESSFADWMIIIGVGVAAVVVTEFLHLSQRVEDAIVYTVLVFTVVVVTLRPAWGNKIFWASLVAIFVMHALALIVLEQGFSSAVEGFHGISFVLAGMAETVLIGSVLWKRSMRSKGNRPR